MSLLQILVANTFRLVPWRRRLRVVLLLSQPLSWLLDAVAFVLRRPLRLATAREYIVAFILGALDKHRVAYFMPPTTDAVPALRAAAQTTGGLLVSTHASAGLARFGLRDICDAGVPVTIISAADEFPIAGSGRGLPTIKPKGAFLVAVRTRWRNGEIVGSMVDAEPGEDDGRLKIADGRLALADPIVRLAARCGVPVFVMHAHLERDRVAVPITEIRAEQKDGDALVEELAQELARSVGGA